MSLQVGADGVVGRDRLIARMWKKLETRSIRFTAERRIGKTTVMKKMEAEAPDGVRVLFLDVEGIDSPLRFAEVLLTKVQPLLSTSDRMRTAFLGLVQRLGGTEIGGLVRLPEQSTSRWRQTLEGAIDGICDATSSARLVLMLDELPYMLQKISAKETRRGSVESAALELLDILRSRRVQHPDKLRMVFAGSVGSHHVLGRLRGDVYASEPLNDMPRQPIGPLDRASAVLLATNLIQVEGVERAEADDATLAEAVARVTDGVPFYIERVVARLAEYDHAVAPVDAEEVVTRHLTDDHDDWEMEHFRARLAVYYRHSCMDTQGRAVAHAKIAATILDVLAVSDEPLSIDGVWSDVKAQLALDDKDQIVQLLASLAKDHYLESNREKKYAFRFPLVRRWWSLAQGLSC